MKFLDEMKKIGNFNLIMFVIIMLANLSCGRSNDYKSENKEIQTSSEVAYQNKDNDQSEEDLENPSKSNQNKLYAEKMMDVAEERLNEFRDYLNLIKNAATEELYTLNDDGSYETMMRRNDLSRLTSSMNYYNVVREELDYTFEYYYKEDYDSVVRIVKRVLESIRSGYEWFSIEVSDVKLDINVSDNNGSQDLLILDVSI